MKYFTRLIAAFALLSAFIFVSASRAQKTGPVLVVTHIDFDPTSVSVGLPALEQFVADSKKDPGVRAFTLITWSVATNHFQLLEVFDSLDAYHNHVQASHTIAFRAAVQPTIGAPLDERLYLPRE